MPKKCAHDRSYMDCRGVTKEGFGHFISKDIIYDHQMDFVDVQETENEEKV